MIFLPLCTSFCWGLSSVFDKLCLDDFSPIMIFIVGGFVYAILCIVLIIYNYQKLKIYLDFKKYKKAWIYSILAGICVYGIANLLYYHALKKSDTPHIVVALAYSAPIFTLLLSVIVLKNDFSLHSLIGVFLVIIGVFVICWHAK